MHNPELKKVIAELENKLMINTNHTCQICGSDLELYHKTDFGAFQVFEAAKCPKCGVTLKNKVHTLH